MPTSSTPSPPLASACLWLTAKKGGVGGAGGGGKGKVEREGQRAREEDGEGEEAGQGQGQGQRQGQAGGSLSEEELVLAAAILAMGARRQAGSHLGACFGFGWFALQVRAVADAVQRLAAWCGPPPTLPAPDVGALALEARRAMQLSE